VANNEKTVIVRQADRQRQTNRQAGRQADRMPWIRSTQARRQAENAVDKSMT
jgi:hypothetical protein